MKFKPHLLALAVSAVAATAPAHAGIDYTSTGNGELFMTLLDAAGLQSYTLDLNVKMDDFLSMANAAAPGATFLTRAADPLLTSFLAGVAPGNFGAMKYAIGGGDSAGANASNYARFVVSSNDIVYSSTLPNLLLRQNFQGSIDSYLGNVNGLMTGTLNSIVVTNPSAVAYAGSAQWGNRVGGAANFTTTALIGTKVNMQLLRQTSGASAAFNTKSIYAPVWGDTSFLGMPGGQYQATGSYPVYALLDNSGNLSFTVTPVPEAETYAMMLAGLGLLGFMARRRLTSRV